MKKNTAAYSNLLPDDLVYPGSSLMFSSAATRQDDHECLLTLNMNITIFLNF
jgi:hypothetical protein